MRHKIPLLLAALLLAPVPALAAPAEIASVIHAGKPYGSGDAGVLFLTAYTATLWTDASGWSMDAPFALTLQYGMGFDTEDLVSRTLKEMKHVDPGFDAAQEAKLTPQLNKAFPPVKSGDRITALYLPGKPVAFYRNGSETGTIDADFAQDFFGIWLSPKTSDTALRAGLLKQK
jgi:chalcone isomerase-like protein